MKKVRLAGCLLGISDEKYYLAQRCLNEYMVETEMMPEIILGKEDVSEEDVTFGYYRDICRKLIDKEVLPFHGAAIKLQDNNGAYIFAGPSGAGKSTQASLWKRTLGAKAVILNDDRPLFRFEEQQIVVCGSPWKGKHHIGVNEEAILKSICFVKKGDSNRISRISPGQAFPFLLRQCFPLYEYVEKVTGFVERMVRTIPIWELICTLNTDAFDVAYQAMVIENGT